MTRTCDAGDHRAGFQGSRGGCAGRQRVGRYVCRWKTLHVGGQLLRRTGGTSHGLGGFEFDGIRHLHLLTLLICPRVRIRV